VVSIGERNRAHRLASIALGRRSTAGRRRNELARMIHHGVEARPADRRPRLAARAKRSEERTANGSDEMRCHDNVAGDVVNHAG
jgi:hypothetical protein